jgi:DNA-binding transcriptional MerR regulator
MDNEYLGITEAAEYLRVSASTLRRWEKKGFLVPERTPTGIRRYTKQQLDDVIQSPDGFSQSHTATEEVTQKLAPHEELQASIEKQLEEINVDSYPIHTNDVQIDALPSNDAVGEEISETPLNNTSVVHNYPPYGLAEMDTDRVDSKLVSEVVSVEKGFQDQIHNDFFNLGNKEPEARVSVTENELLSNTITQRQTVNTIEQAKVEAFHSEYDSDTEPVQDLEEYDSDAASASENANIEKKNRANKTPRVPVWIIIVSIVLIIVFVLVVFLLTKNSASELISPLAE